MKRNSCTQTAASAAVAYSKTGGEIVSASRMRNIATKHVDVVVQTIPSRETPSTPVELDTCNAKYANIYESCAHHQSNAKCKDQSCQTHTTHVVQCSRCNQNSSDTIKLRKDFEKDAPIVTTQHTQQTQTNYASDNSATELTIRRTPQQTNGIQQKQKETKNQINVSKSKCSCTHNVYPSVSDNKYSSNIAETKRAEYYKPSTTTCRLCSKPKSGVDVNNTNTVYICDVCQTKPICTHEDTSRNGQTRARACEHNDVPVNGADRRIIIDKSRQNGNAENQSKCTGKICDCASDCAVCRTPKITTEALCECRSKIAERQSQIYSDGSQDSDTVQQRRVQSRLKCNCDEACSCSSNQAKNVVKAKVCRSFSNPNFMNDIDINETDRNCKHCRVCGAMYQNTRKCSCRQTYPKAVAYELSFAKGSISKSETSNVVQLTPNVSKQPLKAAKSETCLCDIKRNNSNKNVCQKSTLQV